MAQLRKAFLVLVLIFSLGALVWGWWTSGKPAEASSATPAHNGLLAISTQAPAASATLPPPTVDSAATIVSLQLTAAVQEKQIAFNAQTQTAATSEAESRQLAQQQMTAQVDAWTVTAAPTAAAYTATYEAQIMAGTPTAYQLTAIAKTEVARSSTATAWAPLAAATVETITLKSKYAPMTAAIDAYGPVTVIFVLLLLAGLVLWLIRTIEKDTAERAESRRVMLEQEPAPVINHVTLPSAPQVTIRIPDPPGDLGALQEWAAAALAGESLAIDRWERSGPLTGYRVYRTGVYSWLAHYKLMMLDPLHRQVLNPLGDEVVKDWLKRNPPAEPTHSPSTPEPLKTSVIPSVPTATVGTDTEGEGVQSPAGDAPTQDYATADPDPFPGGTGWHPLPPKKGTIVYNKPKKGGRRA
jgi:hypothetical protein